MPKNDLIADGISLVENKAFQSFITRAYKHSHKHSHEKKYQFSVPSAVAKHLSLEPGDLLEVAIRKVVEQYAKDNYSLPFLSFKTVCPICGKIGRVQKLRYNYMVQHYEKGKGVSATHCVSRTEFANLTKLDEKSLKEDE